MVAIIKISASFRSSVEIEIPLRNRPCSLRRDKITNNTTAPDATLRPLSTVRVKYYGRRTLSTDGVFRENACAARGWPHAANIRDFQNYSLRKKRNRRISSVHISSSGKPLSLIFLNRHLTRLVHLCHFNSPNVSQHGIVSSPNLFQILLWL